jgi:hypothetical protein
MRAQHINSHGEKTGLGEVGEVERLEGGGRKRGEKEGFSGWKRSPMEEFW